MRYDEFSKARVRELNETKHEHHPLKGDVHVCGIGSSFPEKKYTQKEIQELLGINNPTVHKLLRAEHIQTRHLYLPDPPAPGQPILEESVHQLNQKFDMGVLDIGVNAAKAAITNSPFKESEIDFLICVSSTGFRLPGISSVIARTLGLKNDLYRLDVVGMGCNAGMSALRTATALSSQGLVGLMVCCEVCSAIYVRDESIKTGVVNSLFGDGAVAVVTASMTSYSKKNKRKDYLYPSIEIINFSSFTLPEEHQAMKFDWNDDQKKWSFNLSKQIPFVVGNNIIHPIKNLLEKCDIQQNKIAHWSIHTGGAAVIAGVIKNLGLTEWDLRHTRSVLRDYGNISSGSFLVSLERLLAEPETIKDNDLGILAAMGPGATLEAALVQFHIQK